MGWRDFQLLVGLSSVFDGRFIKFITTGLGDVMKQRTREEWLQEAADLILEEQFRPIWTIRKNLKVKVSVGYAPNTRAGSKTIGVCLSAACSAKGYNEIFINPVINDSLRVLDVLVHELIHAIDDNENGHKGTFALLARKVGLEGNLTATRAGENLAEYLQTIVDILGDIPHAKVDLSNLKQQTNRHITVVCSCGFRFNTSRMQIENVLAVAGGITCPACTDQMQIVEK